MADEILAPYGVTGRTCYAVVRDSTGRPWSAAAGAFGAYAAGDWADYAVALAEQGASGVYAGDFPAAIPAGVFTTLVYDRAGGTPAEDDPLVAAGEVQWTGTAVASYGSGVPVALVPSSLDAVVVATGIDSPRYVDPDGNPVTTINFRQAVAVILAGLAGDRSGVGTRTVAATIPGSPAAVTATRASRTAIEATVVVPP